VSVQPPTPSALAGERCTHLNDQLPQDIESLKPRVISPRTPFVHAWGDPAIVLTCGVPLPAGYSPTSSETTAVNGISWFEQQEPDQVVWTAVSQHPLGSGERLSIRLTVPTSYQGQGAFLVDLAGALKTTLP
jgi:hypothetical protein